MKIRSTDLLNFNVKKSSRDKAKLTLKRMYSVGEQNIAAFW